jgi:hypothetical protein
METSGDLPADFDAIRARLSQKQDAAGRKPQVDYIHDVPIELAKSLTGFRHDHFPDDGVARFERLVK